MSFVKNPIVQVQPRVALLHFILLLLFIINAPHSTIIAYQAAYLLYQAFV